MSFEFIQKQLWSSDRHAAGTGSAIGKAGEAFGLEYKATVGRIIQAPLRWPTYVQGTRRHLMHRFPYAIVYRTESDGAVLIVAIAHQAKDEAYWKSRAALPEPDAD